MRKRFLALVLGAILVSTVAATSAVSAKPADKDRGFNEYGYNYNARIFVGKFDGANYVWGDDPVYGNDHLVMKWSKAWDDAMWGRAPWGPDAWCSNEWNGLVAGGSGTTGHVKMVWVGPGEEIEVIMDQGTTDLGHYWGAHAIPNGYGVY